MFANAGTTAPFREHLEHFLHSPAGDRGVATSDAQYALAGGDARFMNSLRAAMDYDADAALAELVRDWRDMGRGGATTDWVPELLAHLYGEERARALWPRSGP